MPGRMAQRGVRATMLLCGVLAGPAWAQNELPTLPAAMESEAVLRERLQQNGQEREQLLRGEWLVRDQTAPRELRGVASVSTCR